MGLFLMPGTKRGAGFHGWEDANQYGMVTSLGMDGLDAFFLVKGHVLADEPDLEAGLDGKLFAVLA